ncbi:MAG: 2-methylcitrate synthase/citrate synthase, partial [Pseudomonadota bacterium]
MVLYRQIVQKGGEMEIISGLAGIPIAESQVSNIDGARGRLDYRGISIEELVDKSTFLEVAWLLIYGELPTKTQLETFNRDVNLRQSLKFRIVDIMKNLPESAHPMTVMQSMTSILGAFHDGQEDPEYDTITRLIAKTAAITSHWSRIRYGNLPVSAREDFSFAENLFYMMGKKQPSKEIATVLDKCLILHAEHTMNASTFATLVVGSTLADPYKVMSAAMGSLSGPLHGGANEEVIDMLKIVGRPENAKAYVEEKMATGQRIMGFGHRVYKTYDPRAKKLEELLTQVAEMKHDKKMYETAKEIEKHALEKLAPKGLFPNVDFYSGCIYNLLGIPSDLFTPLFAIARTPGWIAHWREYKA